MKNSGIKVYMRLQVPGQHETRSFSSGCFLASEYKTEAKRER